MHERKNEHVVTKLHASLSFLCNLIETILLELSHLDAIFLLNFPPDTYRTKASGFFVKEIAQVLTRSFFTLKVFTRLEKEFL